MKLPVITSYDQRERTRFLKQLDQLLLQDPQGAIDDMLQVLEEHGAIFEMSAEVASDTPPSWYSDYDAELGRIHNWLQEAALNRLGNELGKQKLGKLDPSVLQPSKDMPHIRELVVRATVKIVRNKT